MKWARDVAWFLVLGAALSVGKRWIVEEPRPVLVVEGGDEAILVDIAIRAGAVTDPVVRDRLERNLAFVGERGVEAAIAMEMHRKDPIARARLASIGRAIILGRLAPETPDDAVLEAYARAHADRYAKPAAARFEHELVGDEPFPVPLAGMQSARRIDAVFGVGFAAEVMRAPIGRWTEIRSSYGVHRVRVAERREAELPPIAQIRARVLADWRRDREPERLAEALSRLRDQIYELRTEGS